MVARRTTAEPREGARAPVPRTARAVIAGAVIVRAAADMVPSDGWK